MHRVSGVVEIPWVQTRRRTMRFTDRIWSQWIPLYKREKKSSSIKVSPDSEAVIVTGKKSCTIGESPAARSHIGPSSRVNDVFRSDDALAISERLMYFQCFEFLRSERPCCK